MPARAHSGNKLWSVSHSSVKYIPFRPRLVSVLTASGILYGHPNCFLQLLLSSGLEYSLFSLMPIQIPCLITSWLEPPLTSSTLPYPPSALAACWSGLKTLGNEVPLSETFVHVDLYAT